MTQLLSGPYLYSLGQFDTLANLTTAFPASGIQAGTCALCQDVGFVYSDSTSWKTFGAGGAAQVQLITTGAGGTVGGNVKNVFLNGAGTTFALTLRAPTGQGDRIEIDATQAISVAFSTVATSPATVIKNTPSTLAAGVGIAYVYNVSDTTWYRVY